jgi:hypothetical protein
VEIREDDQDVHVLRFIHLTACASVVDAVFLSRVYPLSRSDVAVSGVVCDDLVVGEEVPEGLPAFRWILNK